MRENHPAFRPLYKVWRFNPEPSPEWCPVCLIPSLLRQRVMITDVENPTIVHRQGWVIGCHDCDYGREEIDDARPSPDSLAT
jgi:hypothetical protein